MGLPVSFYHGLSIRPPTGPVFVFGLLAQTVALRRPDIIGNNGVAIYWYSLDSADHTASKVLHRSPPRQGANIGVYKHTVSVC